MMVKRGVLVVTFSRVLSKRAWLRAPQSHRPRLPYYGFDAQCCNTAGCFNVGKAIPLSSFCLSTSQMSACCID